MNPTTARFLSARGRVLAAGLALGSILASHAGAQCPPPVASNPNPVLAGINLSNAIASVGTGVTCTISINPGTYQGNFVINNQNITLQPVGAALSVILDGGGSGTVLTIQNTAATVISGLVIQNGSAIDGGGLLIQDASPQIAGCRITNNVAAGRGGGVYVFGSNMVTTPSTPRFSNTYVTDNAAGNDGGGFAFLGQTGSITNPPVATITNCTVRLNQAGTMNPGAGRGGGIYAVGGAFDGGGTNIPEVSISRTRLSENTVDGFGGGAAFHFSPYLEFDHDWILSNQATMDGGGVWSNYGCAMTIKTCAIEENQAANRGGGVYVRLYNGGYIRSSTIDHNSLSGFGSLGGGIYIENTGGMPDGGNGEGTLPTLPAGLLPFNVRNNLIVTNQAADGGGVYVQDATPAFSFNSFNQNLAAVGVTGGMLVSNAGGFATALVVTNSIYWQDIGTTPPTFPWQVEFQDLGVPSTVSFCDVQGSSGPGWFPTYGFLLDTAPVWVKGYTCSLAPIDGYFLSQPSPLSPCVNVGTGVLPAFMLGRTTNATGAADASPVDIGYHYPPTNCP